MLLGLSVLLVVLGVTAVAGLLGYLIDKSEKRHEYEEGRDQ